MTYNPATKITVTPFQVVTPNFSTADFYNQPAPPLTFQQMSDWIDEEIASLGSNGMQVQSSPEDDYYTPESESDDDITILEEYQQDPQPYEARTLSPTSPPEPPPKK